jgi:uncharacterized membrane protein YdjX (TVP38/TMEM64 family)
MRGLRLRHVWPLLLALLAVGLFYAFGLQHNISPHVLLAREHELRDLVAAYPLAAGAAYAAATAVYLMLSLPAEGLLTILGGVLFGTLVGSALSVFGTVAAAVLLFLAFEYMLPPPPAIGGGTRSIDRVWRELQRDAFNYVLFLRLVPVLPFALVSGLPVLVGMRLRSYVVSTTIGVIPPAVVFTSLGGGIAGTLEKNPHVHLSSLVNVRVMLPLIGLAALSLLPIAWRQFRPRRH